MNKRLISAALAASMLLPCAATAATVNAVVLTENAEVSAGDYDLADNIQDGVILHCFCWRYNDIKAMLPEIAEAGFTSIQVSPPQEAGGTGTWWWAYQPLGFYIGTSALGTKSELQSLCQEADNYGIKIVADVVANHLAGDHSRIQNDLKDSKYWHANIGSSQDGDRYQVTHGTIGMPDLNTENSYVQQCVAKYVQELKSVGVDGIRWDAAKHIGLPSEGDNFWKTVTADSGLWHYGEILNNPGVTDEPRATNILKEYCNYMSVTDSTYGMNLRNSFNDGSVPSAYGYLCEKGIANNKLVYWGESHDTWSNNKDWGYSNDMSQNVIDRAYAVAASHNDVTALYFSRPSTAVKDSITLGQKGSTHFTSAEVAEVNKFHNAMVGKADDYTASNGCSVTTRQGGGAVIVKGSGSGNVTVENAGGYAKPGTYTDRISGNTFTVTATTISGQIGSSGIAVIYEEENPKPKVSVTPGSSSYNTDTYTLTLNAKNTTNAQYSIDNGSYQTYTDGKTITIGSGLAYGTKTTVSVKATDGTTTSDPETYTYTKVDPSLVQKVYFDNSSYNWSSAYAYIYADSSTNNGAWPGVQMTKDSSTGYYVVEVPEELANGYVILTESKNATSNRYPADGETGMALNGKTMIMRANHSWEEYTETPATTAAPTTQATTAQPTTVAPTTVPVTTAPADKVLIGDVNLDGRITISDATEIQYHSSEYKVLTGNSAVAADTDKNGAINIKDATAVQCYIAGLTESSAYCGEYVGGETPTTQPTTTQPATQATQPTTAPSGNYLYYKNTNGWSTVKAYYWSDSNTKMTTWPGVDTTSVGNNTYRVEVPSEATYVIFNDGGSNKTGDLSIPGYNKIYENGSWSDYSGDVPSTTAPAGDYVYYYNSNGWSSVNAYYWSDGNTMLAKWPGVDMESVGNNVYRTKYPSAATYIIFSNNGSNQTSTITLSGANKIYKNGSWSTYNG